MSPAPSIPPRDAAWGSSTATVRRRPLLHNAAAHAHRRSTAPAGPRKSTDSSASGYIGVVSELYHHHHSETAGAVAGDSDCAGSVADLGPGRARLAGTDGDTRSSAAELAPWGGRGVGWGNAGRWLDRRAGSLHFGGGGCGGGAGAGGTGWGRSHCRSRRNNRNRSCRRCRSKEGHDPSAGGTDRGGGCCCARR